MALPFKLQNTSKKVSNFGELLPLKNIVLKPDNFACHKSVMWTTASGQFE